MLIILLTVTALGAALGSTLALACQRYSPTASPSDWFRALWTPPSRCMLCRAPILWRDKIPLISWLCLQGRCRACRQAIGVLPLLFELTGALLCLMLVIVFNACPLTAAFILVASCLLLLLAVIDQRHFLLPDVLTGALLWLGLSRFFFAAPLSVTSAVGGAVAGYGSLWLLAWLYRQIKHQEGLGNGDIKLFAALGIWCGWQALPWIALIASVSALLAFAVRAIIHKRLYMNSPLPFGPFLAAAGWGMIVLQSLIRL
ncbi:A24 family peptidase [Pantoea sp. SIMBA_133]